MPFQLGLPAAEDLLPGVKQVLADLNREQHIPISLDVPAMMQLARNLVGLPEEEALRALRKVASWRAAKPMRDCSMPCWIRSARR